MSDITKAIVETMSQPVLVLESDLEVAAANGAFYETFEVNPDETLNRLIYELGNGQWNIAELRNLLEEILPASSVVTDYRVEHVFEAIGRRTMLVNARTLEQYGFDRILVAISDITERERFQSEIAAARELSDKLIDSIREGLVVLDPDLRVHRVNETFCKMFKVADDATRGRLLFEIGNGQWDIPELRKALTDVLPRNSSFDDYEVTHEFPVLGRRTMLLNARRLDHLPRILLAIRDVTEERRHAESEKLMVGELQHRVKNILATVQSMATSTLRRSRSLEEFGESYVERIQSMARAQDLLLSGPEGSANLRDLIGRELSAHGWEEDGRLSFSGPAVVLNRQETQALAMVIHELATNAVKYGAFYASGGRLDVGWHLDDDRVLSLTWKESGVPLEEAPEREGFGTNLIRSSIGYVLRGTSSLCFEADGIRCELTFPLGNR